MVMHKPIKTNFVPRWARNASAAKLEALADTPFTGERPLEWPRIVARVLPPNGRNCLDSKTVVEILETTQRLAQYAACDEILGPNPNFADLRQLESSIVAFSKLTVEPFEEGSFVIPTHLEADDLHTEALRQDAEPVSDVVSTEQVATRFGAILESVESDAGTTAISIGALETVRQMNRTLKRDVAAIEFATFDRFEDRRCFQRVDANYIKRVEHVIQHRKTTISKLESLTGTVTALDLHKDELRLSLSGQNDRVRGTFASFLHPALLDSLGKRVELFGKVDFKDGQPRSIAIQQAEVLD